MSKYLGRLGPLTLVWQLIKEKKSYEFKPVKCSLKIDVVSHPVLSEELGKYK